MSSKLGRFVRQKASWTLPDVRPKNPVMVRSKMGQMRVSAEAFYDEHLKSNPQTGRDGLGARPSRPGGVKRRHQFRYNTGDTRGNAKRLTGGMKFGPWDY